jgi:hypothetical protein
MMQDILVRFDAPAAKLGVTAQYLWATVLRQAYVTAYVDIALAVLFAVIGIISAFAIQPMRKYANDHRDHVGDWGIFPYFGFIAVCAGVLTGLTGALVNAVEATTILLNPAFWALRNLFNN